MKPALDARDGLAPNLLTNQEMLGQMGGVDSEPLWSILDQKGTQYMMRGLLGEASQLTDYDTVKKRLLSSRYTMNFQNGVKFSLDVATPDTFTAATLSSAAQRCRDVQEGQRHGHREDGRGCNHDRLQRRPVAGPLRLFRQPVLRAAAIAAVPVSSQVSSRTTSSAHLFAQSARGWACPFIVCTRAARHRGSFLH